jgi:hypothetical protein
MMAIKKSVKPEAVDQNARKLIAKGTPKKVAMAIAENVQKAAKKKAARKGK